MSDSMICTSWTLASFLTGDALARLTEPGADALFVHSAKPRTPTDVHNLLKRFLQDDYRFRHTFDVYAFTSLLAEATTNNATWASTFRLYLRGL